MTSLRLLNRVLQNFAPSEADTVLELLAALDPVDGDPNPKGVERVQAAVILLADGDSRRFLSALALALGDWRDVLVASGLADADWPKRLDEWLTDPRPARRAQTTPPTEMTSGNSPRT